MRATVTFSRAGFGCGFASAAPGDHFRNFGSSPVPTAMLFTCTTSSGPRWRAAYALKSVRSSAASLVPATCR